MFLFKILSGNVKIIFILILLLLLLNRSSGSNQEDKTVSKTYQNVTTECEELLTIPIVKPNEKTGNFSMKKNPFVYRKQDFNESMEKIQTLDNGVVMKSIYIPILPNKLNLNYSDVMKIKFEESGSNFLKNKSRAAQTQDPTNLSNENFIIKNGKKYKVIKVKKTSKNLTDNHPKNQIQRRTFKPLPSFMSFLPLNWLTRQKKNESVPNSSESNVLWSKLNFIENREENSKEILKSGVQTSEKVKKLLNLFTIVKFENGECSSNGIKGTCMHKVECETKGGKFEATCAGDLGVCCYYEKTCGDTSGDSCTYFVNEGFPDSSDIAPRVCTLTIEKSDPDVKQLRLDFKLFQLREPTNGTCLQDRLVMSGQDLNDVVPEICGINTGQHIYIDVEDSNGPFSMNIITMGEYFPRNFRIKVTQVKKEDELLSPRNCLQYYPEPFGYIQSFNYHHDINENLDEIENGYLNNLNYAICIKKQKGFCSISYENEEIDDTHPAFHLVNVDEEGAKLLPPRQAGAETFDCPDDYIIINGMRLCGEKLNDASVEIDFTRNHPVTDTTNGPFMVSVKTDASVSGRGFYLKFTQHPCLN